MDPHILRGRGQFLELENAGSVKHGRDADMIHEANAALSTDGDRFRSLGGSVTLLEAVAALAGSRCGRDD
jgi:hypothetical protein